MFCVKSEQVNMVGSLGFTGQLLEATPVWWHCEHWNLIIVIIMSLLLKPVVFKRSSVKRLIAESRWKASSADVILSNRQHLYEII